MIPGTYVDDGLVHVCLVALAAAILGVSLAAYYRRRTSRYLFLSLAFGFLFASQLVSMIEVLFLSDMLLMVPLLGVHLSHFFDLLTLVSFATALLRSWEPPIRRATKI